MKALTSKEFAWYYLVTEGLCGFEHSYYGGYNVYGTNKFRYYTWDQKGSQEVKDFALPDPRKLYDYDYQKQFIENRKSDILEIGVDWDKTEAPRSDKISEFNGTFADPSYKEILEGVLVLKDGTKQYWMAKDVELTNVFDVMEQMAKTQNQFCQLFGEK